MIVFRTIRRQSYGCRPNWTGKRYAALAHVAAVAIHIVKDVFVAQLLCINKQVIATTNHTLQLRVKITLFQILHGWRHMHVLAFGWLWIIHRKTLFSLCRKAEYAGRNGKR